MYLEHRLSVLLQLHLHSRLKTWLQWIGQRQLQDQVTNIHVLWFGGAYTRGLTVHVAYVLHDVNWPLSYDKTYQQNMWRPIMKMKVKLQIFKINGTCKNKNYKNACRSTIYSHFEIHKTSAWTLNITPSPQKNKKKQQQQQNKQTKQNKQFDC